MKTKTILGHIDCPTCGTVAGMRITHDKNGDPFGYCEAECNQQMRIGGDARRVRKFVDRHPWAGRENPVTVTAKPAPVTAPVPAPAPARPAPVTVKAPEPEVKKAASSPFSDAVAFLSGVKP